MAEDIAKDSDLSYKLHTTPVAIIGMASIFPKATNLSEYWDNILKKIDCITDVPPSRWSIEDYYDPNPNAPDKTYCKRGGFMQLLKTPHITEELPAQFVDATNQQTSFFIFGTLQVLDDCAPSLSFERANIYSGVKLKDGDRIRRNIILPYRMTRSSKSFSLYEYVTD